MQKVMFAATLCALAAMLGLSFAVSVLSGVLYVALLAALVGCVYNHGRRAQADASLALLTASLAKSEELRGKLLVEVDMLHSMLRAGEGGSTDESKH